VRENSFISNSKFILRIVVFLVCMVVVFHFVGESYQKAGKENKINAFTKQRLDDFYGLKKDSLDMVFVGSSHAYCTFDPEIFDKKLAGKRSFQMGTPLQHPDTTYYLLKEIYQTQTPKTVVMELYWDVLDGNFSLKQAESYLEVSQNEEIQKEYLKKGFPMGARLRHELLPIRFQQEYFAFASKSMEENLEEMYAVSKKKAETQGGTEYYRSKGYVFCDMMMLESEYNTTNQFRNLDGKKWTMAKRQREYLEKIVALCKDKGSQVIFVTAPVANVSMDYIKNYENIHEQVAKVAEELSVPYWDYNIINKEDGLLTNADFRDDAHLNDAGVQKVDRDFLNRIQEDGVKLQS